MRVGLVLGAGGIQGGAWLTGALHALATETGWDPMEADNLVGTSAGSMIAAIVAGGTPVWFMVAHSAGETIDGLLDVNGQPASDADRSAGAVFRPAKAWPPIGPGSWLLALRTMRHPRSYPPGSFLAACAPRGFVSTKPLKETVGRVVQSGWSPHPNLWIMACDYATGRRVAFGREGSPKAELTDAVAASCAIPGFYHPVGIGNSRYVDGGIYSTSNLDVLRDEELDLVICLNPTSSRHPTRAWNPLEWGAKAVRGATGRRLGHETKKMQRRGTEVLLIQPTEQDLASMGRNLMSSRNRHRTLTTAIDTVRAQLQRDDVKHLLADLPKAARPEKVDRPAGPPSSWPTLDLSELRPGSPIYAEGESEGDEVSAGG
ncbi:patatin-like phospholipase family protein [soil metagenome]